MKAILIKKSRFRYLPKLRSTPKELRPKTKMKMLIMVIIIEGKGMVLRDN